MKNALIIVAGFLAIFISVSVFILYESGDVSQEEGFTVQLDAQAFIKNWKNLKRSIIF